MGRLSDKCVGFFNKGIDGIQYLSSNQFLTLVDSKISALCFLHLMQLSDLNCISFV